MKKTEKLVPQVLLRRMILVLLDAAIVIFSFYFALLLRADGAVEASWWPHNRALLYQNLPWIVALYLLSFLAGGLYHVLWKYAGERDLIRLGGMIAVPTGVVYFVNHFCVHGVLFDSANAMAAVLIFLLVGGSRLAWRLFLNHPIGERLRGDAELMLAGGLFLGVKGVVVGLFLGLILGCIFGMIHKAKTGDSKFAFGPYLSAGMAMALVVGEPIANLYLQLCGLK